ncbi:magnesium chelatase subunit D [Glacieibacterium frigidum]|uniref:Magnesium chelatase subunit D n=1 Tax=Glacieibacterium frigidum TaxID=2593303 RepID=A0A552UAG0_9SPHN|nr:magnesium chelatase subunit D [Glacieibacterium frigidum]TRW15195.1 magnesium chelatase subunit D [Glacieibacterium frigidum]
MTAALELFAVDPLGLGGIVLRGPADGGRDRWLADLTERLETPPRRLPSGIDDARLLGGLDVAATLAAGRPVVARGLLAEADGGVIVVPMAERLGDGLAGRLAGVLDAGEVVVERDGAGGRSAARVGVVLLDEGVDDEAVATSLAERAGLWISADKAPGDPALVVAARARLAELAAPSPDILAALCGAALVLGVDSARATIFALRAARAAAALAGRREIEDEDVALAARLVLGPRATRLPDAEPEAAQGDAPPADPPPPGEDGEPSGGDADSEARAQAADALTDLVLAAARSAVPADLLSGTVKRRRSRKPGPEGGRGAGERRPSWRRGRPAGTRSGMPGGGKRLALAATLGAAAVWQRARGATEGRVIVHRDDLRIRRFETRAETTAIVVVDASGSAALARLAEAKGAVELLLAQAYVLRTQVALVTFRGQGATLLLPPTRSLTRARRALAELAGGGGTPLAAGLDMALTLALAERARGRTPQLVILTDGRGNVARVPEAGRAQAVLDADAAARAIADAGIASALIDTAPRPRAETRAFAGVLGARYIFLPRVEAGGIADAVRAA